MNETSPSPEQTCPDWPTWCGYVDGSIADPRRAELTSHLATCDRCFATVTEVRRDLSELEETVAACAQVPAAQSPAGPRSADAARRRTRHAVFAAAATLALVWMGLWQVTRNLAPDLGPATAGSVAGDGPAAGRVFGFAADIDGASRLQAPVHVHIVFTQFGHEPARDLPAWAADLLEPPDEPADACGATWRGLQVQGELLPRRYRTRLPVSTFAVAEVVTARRRFAREIASQVTADLPATAGTGSRVVVLVTPEPSLLGAPALAGAAGDEGLRLLVVAEDLEPASRHLCGYLREASR